MPTETFRRGALRWRGIVKVQGKTVSSKWFGTGEKERRRAILWEEAEKKRISEEARLITTGSLSDWADSYLDDVKRRCSQKTYDEKRSAFKRLAAFCGGNREMTVFTPGFALSYLQRQYDERSGYGANKDRKNLVAAWMWGSKFIDGFPSTRNPFLAVDRFSEERKPRYVPPVEDFYKIHDLAQGQDRVMLTTFLHLAARRGEIFRLQWSDVNFRDGVVRLTTRKTRDGSMREDWIPMTRELKRELLHWWEVRPFKASEYVFTVLENSPNHNPGGPFICRQHFMKRICEKADVKPFGFHAIRHLSAVVLYKSGEPVSRIQKILRHQQPTTTNRYLASLGFELEEMRKSVEVLSREPAKVIPLPKKSEAS